jgi:hypothetical protein
VRRKRERQGPLGKTAIPFLPSAQNREEGIGAARRPAPAIAGALGGDSGRDRGKGRGGRGLTTPGLTLVGGGLRRWHRGEV